MKDCTSPSAGELKELPRLEGMVLRSAYQKATEEEKHFSWETRVVPAPATTAELLFLKGQKATVCCFWLLFVRVPESKVYEQNMGVSWQYSVLSEGHASGVLEKEALCLGGPKTSA